MDISDLRALPAFSAAWPSCRDAMMEFLSRRLLALNRQASTELATQNLAKLIEDLEKLDSEPRPIVKPKMLRPLNSMQTQPNHNNAPR